MTELSSGLDGEVQRLAQAVDGLTKRNAAAVFSICGRALMPLVQEAERRSNRGDVLPVLDRALAVSEGFAMEATAAGDHHQARERLMAITVPGGHPWGTFVQDALICADAGLAASSASDHPDPAWISYAIEPVLAVLEIRDAAIIRACGITQWERQITDDPVMAAALKFLRKLTAEVPSAIPMDLPKLHGLAEEGAVLCPQA